MRPGFISLRYLLLLLALLMIFCFPLSAPKANEYLKVTGPCNLSFPRDHGAHLGYRVEWWYYTGNLRDGSGKDYGFQLTFFRTQLSPPGTEENWPLKSSAWRTQQIYLAHAALSDIGGKVFMHDERMARGALDLAGVQSHGEGSSVHLGTWSAHMGSKGHRLRADTDRFTIDLMLIPLKPPGRHGMDGYSRKGQKRKSASCYYSFTRLKTSGEISIGGRSVHVKGTAWMDHEFSSEPLEPDIVGWDWFSIQLEDNTELMVYLLRKSDGSYSSASSGTFIDENGKAFLLSEPDYEIEIHDHWKSPRSQALYPSRWRLRVPQSELELMIDPNLDDQELVTSKSAQVTYWEGSVRVSGSKEGKPIKGVGYVEMTGYAGPFDLTK